MITEQERKAYGEHRKTVSARTALQWARSEHAPKDATAERLTDSLASNYSIGQVCADSDPSDETPRLMLRATLTPDDLSPEDGGFGVWSRTPDPEEPCKLGGRVYRLPRSVPSCLDHFPHGKDRNGRVRYYTPAYRLAERARDAHDAGADIQSALRAAWEGVRQEERDAEDYHPYYLKVEAYLSFASGEVTEELASDGCGGIDSPEGIRAAVAEMVPALLREAERLRAEGSALCVDRYKLQARRWARSRS